MNHPEDLSARLSTERSCVLTQRSAYSEAQLDPGFQHWLRWLGVYGSVLFSCLFFVGFVLVGWMFDRTGYRKRDVLLLFVPFVNANVLWRSLWRYTARSVYWSPRKDRESRPLQKPQRPVLIGAGFAVWYLLIGGAIAAGLVSDSSAWDDPQYERGFIIGLMDAGYDEFESRCIVGYLEEAFPAGPPEDEDDPAWVLGIRRGVNICVS